MGVTVLKLIREHSEMKQRIRILEEIRGFLERSLPRGADPSINVIYMSDRSPVDEEVIQDMICEFEGNIAEYQTQVEALEKKEIPDGKAVKKGKGARGKSGATGKGGSGAGKTSSKPGGKNKKS
jgi:hypothetical protein